MESAAAPAVLMRLRRLRPMKSSRCFENRLPWLYDDDADHASGPGVVLRPFGAGQAHPSRICRTDLMQRRRLVAMWRHGRISRQHPGMDRLRAFGGAEEDRRG